VARGVFLGESKGSVSILSNGWLYKNYWRHCSVGGMRLVSVRIRVITAEALYTVPRVLLGSEDVD